MYSYIKLQTSGGFLLDALWCGPLHPKTVFIFIHGLGSNVFSHHEVLLPLVNEETSVLFFSNRGHDTVTTVKKIDRRKKRGYRSFPAGKAHEVFTDCVDDIAAAVEAAKEKGAQKIILVGHSTGCQKSIYYLAHLRKHGVAGVVLLAPLSDYADFIRHTNPSEYQKTVRMAQRFISEGKPHQLLFDEMLPKSVSGPIDAQRFLSLYTPNSLEELFCYVQKGKIPTDLQKVKIPLLVLLAQNDEYRDRSMKQIVQWFERYQRSKKFSVEIISGASHSFWGKEKEVISVIHSFLDF